ncbi:MAG: hypothetical protein VX199_07780 [Chloroflexota bacterium]|nr:hypothetical protein [Chloroflexota bacterium]
MAKTSFEGPVRSKGGYKLYSVASSTGVDADRTVHDLGIKDTRRWYLEEYFNHLPGVNGDLASTTESTNTPVNRSFEILGTNHTSALATYSATIAGMAMTTATADQDRMIVAPHLDTKQGAWAGTKWGTENQVHWECSIRTSSAIDNQWIWAGLKLTNVVELATDANSAFFSFGTDADNAGQAFTDFTKLHFSHSIANTDYISQLPITVAADTNYHLKIVFDSDRKLTIYVNGIQYNITSTAGSTGGTAVTAVQPGTVATKSAAMTDDIDLIPYIGIENCDAAAAVLNVQYEAISRLIFE